MTWVLNFIYGLAKLLLCFGCAVACVTFVLDVTGLAARWAIKGRLAGLMLVSFVGAFEVWLVWLMASLIWTVIYLVWLLAREALREGRGGRAY